MKKRIAQIAAVVVLTIFILTVACTGPARAAAALDAAVQKNAALTDMDVSIDMQLQLSQGEAAFGMNTVTNMKAASVGTEQMTYLADMTLALDAEELTQEITVNTFYQDGYCYSETLGQKIKYALDLDSMMNTLQQNLNTSELSSEQMTDLSMRKENGQQIISFTADPELMNEQVENSLGLLQTMMAAYGELEMEIQDVHGTYYINSDGYYSAADLVMSYSMSLYGETIQVDAVADMTFHDPGEPVEIALPDTSDYMEMSLTGELLP